jgi:hypothetical protein
MFRMFFTSLWLFAAATAAESDDTNTLAELKVTQERLHAEQLNQLRADFYQQEALVAEVERKIDYETSRCAFSWRVYVASHNIVTFAQESIDHLDTNDERNAPFRSEIEDLIRRANNDSAKAEEYVIADGAKKVVWESLLASTSHRLEELRSRLSIYERVNSRLADEKDHEPIKSDIEPPEIFTSCIDIEYTPSPN